MNLLIKNIKSILGYSLRPATHASGAHMDQLGEVKDAWMLASDGKISEAGEMRDWPGVANRPDTEVVDAKGKFLLPCWCDSHTHTVYAGSRESEFVDRINGLSYEEIAARGGGILNSAKQLAAAPEAELFESAWKRLDEMMRLGTGAVEIKSGYGLALEPELKMLRVIRQLKEKHPLTIKATFLAAHAVPAAYKLNHSAFLDLVVDEMLPAVAAENLAEFIDVFCEENYFSVADTERILEAGAKYGLIPKVHTNQFNIIGGVGACVRHRALSVDHLELVSDNDIEALKNSATMPVALPGCSLFLGIPFTPARKIIDAGLPLALATDFNPGSAPSGNMNLVNSLACINMKMTPGEVINASTLNGAYAMNLSNELGTITPGKKANFIITKEISSPASLMYHFGSHLIDAVYIEGKKVA